MPTPKTAILHPGQMGISIAASMQNSGCSVHWASAGRSRHSRERAEQFNLIDASSLSALAAECELLVSVCPPEFAEELSQQVIETGFSGLYLDANAIAPQRAARMAAAMESAGISFVDGSIVGGPAWEPGRTWLYISGERAEESAGYFHAGPLGTRVISPDVGKASALKMCFAAYTKGSRAMLCAILGAAENLGVLNDLHKQWGDEFYDRAADGAVNVTAKAWRFAGEMDEIAATFQEAGLPGGFHEGAGDLYRRMAHFKNADPIPSFEEVLAAIAGKAG